MKTITGILALLFIAYSAVAGSGDTKTTAFEIDTKASKVYWTGKKVSGEHTGYLMIGNGQVFMTDNQVVGADVNLELNTIECTDLSGEWKDKLVGHLKSEDFFSVEKYPNALFKITSVENSETESKVVGNLTLKGITHEISFPAQITSKGETVTAKGTALIDRTRWNIKYGSGKFFKGLGDKLILDEFEIKFELVASATGNNL